MNDLGGELREAREAKGISLTEAAKATRIKERYLKALEANDWMALPTPVQAQGFLRNYAVYLGLNGEQVMARYGQAMRGTTSDLPTPSGAKGGARTKDKGIIFNPRDIEIESTPGTMPAWLSSDVLIGVGLALVVVVVGFGLLSLFSSGSEEGPVLPTATSALTPAMTAQAPPPTTEGGAPVSITPTFDIGVGGVQLSLEAIEHVWVRVTVDGTNVLEGILAPGTPQSWQGAQQIKLETANGAGLQAVVNGQPLESLGERGQAVTLIWGPSGLLTPTPAVSP